MSSTAIITEKKENVRLTPNGKVIGSVRQGDKIEIKNRHANWLLFSNEKFDSAFVWAPSAGFEYINLYNPLVYYDSTVEKFYALEYFRKLFGSIGIPSAGISAESEIFFNDVGLGSHNSIVLQVLDQQIEIVHHGIALYLDNSTQEIFQVNIDFLRPIRGNKNVLMKCGLPDRPYSSTDQRRVSWKVNTLVAGLEVRLERKEWESDWFNAISLITER